MIKAGLTSGWSLTDADQESEEVATNDSDFSSLYVRLGTRLFAASVSSSVEYGWTPFRAGEFQFASAAHSSSSR